MINGNISQNIKSTFFYLVIIYIFALSIKALWVFINYSTPASIYDGTRIIISNDGTRWLLQTKEFISGLAEPSDMSEKFRPIAVLTGYISQITSIKIEFLAFWLPALLSSLAPLAIFMICEYADERKAGILAATIFAISPGFFARTMPGYFDDDMLVLPLLLFSILFLLYTREKALLTHKVALFATGSLITWWYPQSITFNFLIISFFLLYLFTLDRKNYSSYIALLIFAISIIPVIFFAKLILFFVTIALDIKLQNNKIKSLIFGTLGAIGIILGLFLSYDKISNLIQTYILKTNAEATGQIKYASTFGSGIAETSAMKLSDFVFFAANGYVFFIIGLIGLVLLCLKRKELFIIFPMLIFGFFALDGGNRFAIYAVAPIAIGIGFFVSYVIHLLFEKRSNLQELFGGKLKTILSTLFVLLILGSNFATLKAFKVPPAIHSNEIAFLTELDKNLKKNDLIYAWWDFGAAIRYYTKATPHSDSGQNQGNRVFIEAASISSDSQIFARNIITESAISGFSSGIEDIASARKVSDLKKLLSDMRSPEYIPLPKKSDSYLIIRPKDMMGFVEINKVYNQSLMQKNDFYLFSIQNRENDNQIIMSGGITIDKQTMQAIASDGSKKIIKDFYLVKTMGVQKSEYEKIEINPDGELTLINAAPLGAMILCDNQTLNSNIMQLYLFGNYNKNYFVPILYKNGVKAFRLVSPSSN